MYNKKHEHTPTIRVSREEQISWESARSDIWSQSPSIISLSVHSDAPFESFTFFFFFFFFVLSVTCVAHNLMNNLTHDSCVCVLALLEAPAVVIWWITHLRIFLFWRLTWHLFCLFLLLHFLFLFFLDWLSSCIMVTAAVISLPLEKRKFTSYPRTNTNMCCRNTTHLSSGFSLRQVMCFGSARKHQREASDYTSIKHQTEILHLCSPMSECDGE